MADTQTAPTDFDPYASIRKRVLEQMPGGSSGYSEAGSAIPQAPDLASTPTPDFQVGATTDTPSPVDEGPSSTQPTPIGQPAVNPYDPTNPANQGTGGTYNEPAPGNDANQISGWFSSYTGRPPTPQDLTFWLTQAQVNAGGLSWVQNQIANSPEAMAYARSRGVGQPTQAAAAAGDAATGGAATGGGTGTAAVTASPTSSFTDQLRALLLERLKAASGPVDENSPEISSALSAARDESQRLSDRERTALAERLYAQGVGSGGGGLQSNALTQQIQQSAERNAGALSTLRANLIMNAYNQKRTELENDLQLAFASGDAESARAIQIQIANLQATVQRESIGAGLAINAANQNATTVGAGG